MLVRRKDMFNPSLKYDHACADDYQKKRACIEEFLDAMVSRGITPFKDGTLISDIFDFAENNMQICSCSKE